MLCGGDTHVTEGALKRCVVEIRRALEDSAEEPRFIQTLGNAAELLYASDASRVSSELAGHFELAGVFTKAIQYLRLAAAGTGSKFANQEAARYLDHAIELVDRVADTEQMSLRMDLLEQRALLRLSTMDMAGSAADFDAVDSQACLAGNVNSRVKALLDSVYYDGQVHADGISSTVSPMDTRPGAIT
jgi:hypothetical protein